MTTRPFAVLSLLAPLLSTVACGGGSAPASPAGGSADAAPPETFAEVKAEDLAALGPAANAALEAGAPSADAGAAGTKPPTDVAAGGSEPNECAPVAVDYEQRARPKLKACYAEGKKKEPDLKGMVKLVVDINVSGKISSTKIADKTLPEPVAQCMLKALKATPLPEASKCPGKSLTIPITFPTPK